MTDLNKFNLEHVVILQGLFWIIPTLEQCGGLLKHSFWVIFTLGMWCFKMIDFLSFLLYYNFALRGCVAP